MQSNSFSDTSSEKYDTTECSDSSCRRCKKCDLCEIYEKCIESLKKEIELLKEQLTSLVEIKEKIVIEEVKPIEEVEEVEVFENVVAIERVYKPVERGWTDHLYYYMGY